MEKRLPGAFGADLGKAKSLRICAKTEVAFRFAGKTASGGRYALRVAYLGGSGPRGGSLKGRGLWLGGESAHLGRGSGRENGLPLRLVTVAGLAEGAGAEETVDAVAADDGDGFVSAQSGVGLALELPSTSDAGPRPVVIKLEALCHGPEAEPLIHPVSIGPVLARVQLHLVAVAGASNGQQVLE